MVHDLTSGSPLRRILSFTFPILIGNLFQQFYNIVDSIIVGKYLGVEAFAAVGSTGALNGLVLGFAVGICGGLCIPIAQNIGAGDIKQLRRAVAHGVYITAAVSIVISVVMLFCTKPLLIFLKTPENIVDDAAQYLTILFAGSSTMMMYNLLAGYIRALGDSRTPLYYLMIACLLSAVLDLLFVGTLGMGVAGAAWATVFSQFLSGLLCLRAIKRNFPILHFTRDDAKFSFPLCLKLCRASVPVGMQLFITSIGSITLQTAVNGLGSAAVAAMSAGGKVQGVIVLPIDSTGGAIATFASQNYGARRIDRVRTGMRQIMMACAGYSLIALLIAQLWGMEFAKIFLNNSETEIHGLVQTYFSINSFFYIPLSLIYVYRNALQGLGYANAAMGSGILEMIGRAGVSVLLVGTFGFTAACFSNPAAWTMAGLFVLPMYGWVSKKLQRSLQSTGEG